ncbi:MAG: pseudouridine synthase, partial [Polyangiaceae bacterium]|nr:pseudouridine synthase [Polyangiaceae bacterium]
MQDRLQKILARAGVASRRAAEQLVEAGRVRVDGKVTTELGSRADPRSQSVELDGKRIVAEDLVYIIMHKPRAVMSTLDDPEGRPTVADILKNLPLRVYPVGRLDYQTSGALLFTNDGDFTANMLHPRHSVPKCYLVKVEGDMTEEDVAKWREGVSLDDGLTLPAEIIVTKREEGFTWFELILREGRNQQIRRMGEATGFPVNRLTRTSFAMVTIDGMRAGQWRFLTKDELHHLQSNYGFPKHLKSAQSSHAEYGSLQPELGRPAPRSARTPKSEEKRSQRFHDTPVEHRQRRESDVRPDRRSPRFGDGPKPYRPRDSEGFGDRRPPRFGDGPKPYRPRDSEGFGDRRPPRFGDGPKPYRPRDSEEFGDRRPPRFGDGPKPYRPRDDSEGFGDRRPPRFGDGPKPYRPRDSEGGDRRPPRFGDGPKLYRPRDSEGRDDRRPPRFGDGPKPYRPRDSEGFGDRRPPRFG